MWLRLELNVLLRAFRVYTDLKTESLYVANRITGKWTYKSSLIASLINIVWSGEYLK
jgi:hypothetical protein